MGNYLTSTSSDDANPNENFVEEICGICLDSFKQNQTKNCAYTKCCGKCIHTDCLLDTVMKTNSASCPYCRGQMRTNVQIPRHYNTDIMQSQTPITTLPHPNEQIPPHYNNDAILPPITTLPQTNEQILEQYPYIDYSISGCDATLKTVLRSDTRAGCVLESSNIANRRKCKYIVMKEPFIQLGYITQCCLINCRNQATSVIITQVHDGFKNSCDHLFCQPCLADHLHYRGSTCPRCGA